MHESALQRKDESRVGDYVGYMTFWSWLISSFERMVALLTLWV